MPLGESLLGRIVDAAGRPLDRLGPISERELRPLQSRPINPVDRAPIDTILDVGVRAINSLMTIGRGQRMGLFAGSGVGKSVLLGMMARYTAADIAVVGLIGERGREVKEFIETSLGPQGLARSVVIAAPADSPPLLRLQAAAYATLVAEYFRDQGRHVLLLMDSLTRYCMAQREIALAIGEPPATKGYPPSVFAKLPMLVERAGNGVGGGGSITGLYTVLTEGDDPQDPVADHARAILDGHIVLSRELADAGHYPAIDIESSVSRLMHSLVDPTDHWRARGVSSSCSQPTRATADLISVGAYVKGNDRTLDEAIELQPAMNRFLQQNMHEQDNLQTSLAGLSRAITPGNGGLVCGGGMETRSDRRPWSTSSKNREENEQKRFARLAAPGRQRRGKTRAPAALPPRIRRAPRGAGATGHRRAVHGELQPVHEPPGRRAGAAEKQDRPTARATRCADGLGVAARGAAAFARVRGAGGGRRPQRGAGEDRAPPPGAGR